MRITNTTVINVFLKKSFKALIVNDQSRNNYPISFASEIIMYKLYSLPTHCARHAVQTKAADLS